ncbi:unnamed protein product [Linum trigynum]|uniref:Uncharacterized protein n=1 Tax=Linum trigynum TaxID=586398 RepID=A0AAV2E510_9ROSI
MEPIKEPEVLVYEPDYSGILFVAESQVAKIPPVEVRRRKLILDDSDDEPLLPPRPRMENDAGFEVKKKVKFGSLAGPSRASSIGGRGFRG